MSDNVAIVGTGQTRYMTSRREVSVPELAHEAVKRSLDDAGLKPGDIDAVVFGSAPDAFEGVHCPDLWSADAVLGTRRPFMRIHTGGNTGGSAAHAGYTHVKSGLFDVVLVVALQRVGETPDAQHILSTIWDPIYEKDFALNIIAFMGIWGSQFMKETGLTERHMAKVSVKNHQNAHNNPYAHLKLDITVEDVLRSRVIAWPIKLLDVCPRSDGACAVIMASEKRTREITDTPAWILGVGSRTGTYSHGDRLTESGAQDLETHDYLAMAAQEAYRMAGITDPLNQIDVAELYTPCDLGEIMNYESLGFCGRGEGPRCVDEGLFEMTGRLPVNPSGGVMTANPIGATGLIRVAEAALQIMGRADKRQVPGARVALANGAGGAAQFFTVFVLGKTPDKLA